MNHERSPVAHYPRLMSVGSTILFFFLATLRHALFKSNAYDLGWFDQYVYLISQGLPPVVSFWGYQEFHLLADHAAIIFYPVALLYKIYPTVHWLFVIQAIALGCGCWLTWRVSLQAGLSDRDGVMMAVVYLLYPLVFNVNIYGFHPEVIAIPGLLGAVWAARTRKLVWFCGCIALILSCKAVLSLTVAAMGFWLFFFERRRIYGAIALFSGTGWFLVTTQLIIPQFLGTEQDSVSRYGYLGDSVLEIALSLILKPDLIWGRILSLPTLEYLALLFVPIFWGLFPRYLAPLISAMPAFMLNILSNHFGQRTLIQHYAVPIFPFLILVLIAARSGKKTWIRSRKIILAWSLLGFLLLGKAYFFGTLYLDSLDTWQANREAIALIQTREPVMAPSQLIPYLTHRQIIKVPRPETELEELENFKYILLDRRHPGFASSSETVTRLIDALDDNSQFDRIYQRDEVFLYQRH
ncbi:MAG: DUF2079 domain-containing protein [Cyanobacteria bacterium P01_E01_bin.42]